MTYKRVWMLIGSEDPRTEVSPILAITTTANKALALELDTAPQDGRVVEVWLSECSEAGYLARGLGIMEELCGLLEGVVDDNAITLARLTMGEMSDVLAASLEGEENG